MSDALASGFLTTEPPGEPLLFYPCTILTFSCYMYKILKEYKTRYIFLIQKKIIKGKFSHLQLK